jgi:hypothetical protein
LLEGKCWGGTTRSSLNASRDLYKMWAICSSQDSVVLRKCVQNQDLGLQSHLAPVSITCPKALFTPYYHSEAELKKKSHNYAAVGLCPHQIYLLSTSP